MDVFQAIYQRRSTRAFTNKIVSEDEIMRVIDAARWAPSAGNLQPWEFIVIREPERKQELSAAALHQTFLEEAPVIIAVCANLVRSRRGYGSRGVNLYCLQDTAIAAQNMLLAACALGLATCWVGAFHEEKVKEALDIPEDIRPVALVPLGHAAKKPSSTLRRPLAEIVHRESFGK